jgi:hypothetical protein
MNWDPSPQFEDWQGCIGCAHYQRGRCAAYPKGIPLPIISGEVDHMVPRPGQVGNIVFEPMDLEVFHRTRKRVPAAKPAVVRQP